MADDAKSDRETGQTRAWADQVEKLRWLYRVTGVSSADFIGPILQGPLNEAFEQIAGAVKQIKSAETRHRAKAVHTNDVGGES